MNGVPMIELKPKDSIIFTISNDCAEETPKENKLDKEYEPYLFGNTENPIDYWGAVVHLVRSTIGTGILVLPFAFKNVGYLIGILGSICIGILYMNTVHALLFTEYELCKRLKLRNLSFVGVVEKTFENGPKCLQRFGQGIKYLMYFYYGVPTGNAIYLIIIATNMKGVFDSFFAPTIDFYCVITAIVFPVTFLCLIPKLKFLVPLSTLTNVFTMVNVGIILFHSMNFDQFRDDLNAIENVNFIPQFFAMVLQSLYATGIILPLKNDMRKPKSFSSTFGVLNVAFAVLIVLYTTFGLVGYVNYGQDVEGNILQNLPSGSMITVLVYVLYSLALTVTYTLIFYVYFDTIRTNILKDIISNTRFEKQSEYGLRVGLNILAYVMAVAIPNFALFTSIVGTIGIILEIALPALLQMLLFFTSNYSTAIVYRNTFKNSLIILLALSMFMMSSKSCIRDILELYRRT